MLHVFVSGCPPNSILGFRQHCIFPRSRMLRKQTDHKPLCCSIHLLDKVWYCMSVESVVVCFSTAKWKLIKKKLLRILMFYYKQLYLV